MHLLYNLHECTFKPTPIFEVLDSFHSKSNIAVKICEVFCPLTLGFL